MKRYVRADMTCAACHIAGGTQARGGSFVGVYARFPQWNRRAHRVITLQDRIAECFLYSMNGRAPAYASKEMVAIVAYIAWLSRGIAVGSAQPQSDRYIEPLPSASPSIDRGRDDLRHALRRMPSTRRRRHLRRLPAAVGQAFVQSRRGHGAPRPHHGLHSCQHAARRAGIVDARSGVRRRGVRSESRPSGFCRARARQPCRRFPANYF